MRRSRADLLSHIQTAFAISFTAQEMRVSETSFSREFSVWPGDCLYEKRRVPKKEAALSEVSYDSHSGTAYIRHLPNG